MSKIADSISRVRNSMKASKQDAFMTDRFIYSLIYKYGKAIMARKTGSKSLRGMHDKFKTLPCVELIETDKIDACCAGIKSGCKIMKTKDQLPGIMEGSSGLLIKSVTSIDGSIEIYRTEASLYTSMTKSSNFKYNKNKYYWYIDGRMFFPNIEWEAVKIQAIFEDDISSFICEDEAECILKQEQELPFGESSMAEIESMIKQELSVTLQIPTDEQGQDKKDIIR